MTRRINVINYIRFIPISLFALCILLIPTIGGAKDLNASPMKVHIGVSVSSIYDLDLVRQSFNAEFWVWYLFPEENKYGYHPEKTTDIVNAKSFGQEFSFVEKKKGLNWVTAKYDGVIIHDWDMTNYPFDEQHLQIDIEESDLDTSLIVFVPDMDNSGVDSAVSIPGWKVVDFSIETHERKSETSYGDPDLHKISSYPQAIVTITLQRKGLRTLFNLLTAAYIGFILGILVLFLHPEYVDARKVLITTAMITVIGNHYIISATVPNITTFTLIDKIMTATFASICLITVCTVVTSHFVRKKRTDIAITINKIGRWGILTSYVIFNILVVVLALV